MTSIQNFEKLTLPQKIGQLFFIGLPGGEIDAVAGRLLGEITPGGICLFSRNIKTAAQTRRLLDELRAELPIEPFLSLDQEGGLVDRLRRIVTPLPSAKAVSRTGEPGHVEKLAALTAEVVRLLGFNMNFAPVIDVLDEQRQKFTNGLYSRNFGDSKEQVAELAARYLAVLQRGGCLGCIKHFPGYGAAEVDSHEELPLVDISAATFFETDIYPYEQFFKSQDVSALMTGHAVYPQLDLQESDDNGNFLPSSLSYNFVTRLLRNRLGYDNLVITDDLEMGAVLKNYGIEEASVRAIQAGNDFVLICASPDEMLKGFHAVLNAVETGAISAERLDESLARIKKIKSRLRPAPVFSEDLLQKLSGEIKQLNTEVS